MSSLNPPAVGSTVFVVVDGTTYAGDVVAVDVEKRTATVRIYNDAENPKPFTFEQLRADG